MARYIDADNFRKTMIKRFGCIPCLTDYSEASRYDIPLDDALNLAPTADVVPRAEVEKIFAEIEKIRSKEIHKCETLREQENEVSQRKYWEGGYNSLRQLSYWIAELKKKYVEGEG